ncbi:(4Fe-4S)-binding protein [Staphylococcus sp. IVB6181]|uniref:(4Fe-4S)-binding protein n=1 Tax=Staphylococcus sp. IVB6181 TaxID=2929481 RepID=UPI0021D038A1|nr:(4Fe-4S)-binding protein [Staphylococcus sp. IVB6181]UXV35041.1 (4Fe-4S)-binding protein [Staphylococcus sp. IVB6181]
MRKNYTSEAIDVSFEPARCIHAAECVKNLSQVFDTKIRPWIDPSKASADEIARVVELCPSGALEYNRKDGKPNEHHNHTEISIGDDNQIIVKGEFTLNHNGETLHLNRALLKGGTNVSDNPFYTLDGK